MKINPGKIKHKLLENPGEGKKKVFVGGSINPEASSFQYL
jgi:hypothetical protein